VNKWKKEKGKQKKEQYMTVFLLVQLNMFSLRLVYYSPLLLVVKQAFLPKGRPFEECLLERIAGKTTE
jgi:hypothetical protein